MDWFERITGFPERRYAETQSKLFIVNGRLRSAHANREYLVGTLSLPSLAELRCAAANVGLPGRLRLSIAEGDVRAMHSIPDNVGALFQVASQFNMLEMVGPDVTPEAGVARYQHDHTQGPACAMAAAAGTIFRNYLVPIAGAFGQTSSRQLNGLADFGDILSRRIGIPVEELWMMRNGYALASRHGLATVSDHLRSIDQPGLDALRASVRFGLQTDVEITDGLAPGPLVSQIFCSALPVAYSGLPTPLWSPFARLILESAYEAVLLASVLNAARGASNRLILTRLGGGAFGNEDEWIDDAMLRALQLSGNRALDVVLVSYRAPTPELKSFLQRSGFASCD